MAHRVFALIIAIDQYASPVIPNLKECVPDSVLMHNYILEAFGPANKRNIRILRNSEATRQAIISTFRSHFIDNPEIGVDDPIIFYFAGHGTRVTQPQGWDSNSKDKKMEALCPYDEKTVDKQTGEVIRCIPDVTLARLLKQLTIKKRRNVTVIFDCCHSGGSTRKPDNPEYAVFRTRDVLPEDNDPFPPLDRAIWELPEPPIPSPDPENPHARSEAEILLAACQNKELARDGFFTRTLIQHLSSRIGVKTTISDLATLIPPAEEQHPVYLGNPHKILFTNTVIDTQRRTFYLKRLPDGQIEVNAGGIHGISDGSLFQLPNGGGTLTVESTRVFNSFLVRTKATLAAEIPTGTKVFAIPSLKNSTLKVWISPELAKQPPRRTGESWFVIVPDSSKADIGLSLKGPSLHVELRDPLFQSTSCGETSFQWANVKNRFSEFLDAIALFRYQLGRHKSSSTPFTASPTPSAVRDRIWGVAEVTLHRLIVFGPFRQPEIPVKDLFENAVVRLKNSTITEYGVRIKNKSTQELDLYFYAFYFNPADFSIQAWSSMQATKTSAGESVTIGYASGGGDAISFELDNPVHPETGFVKVFASTEPVNGMAFLEQSPAEDEQHLRKARPKDIASRPDWGAWLGAITVTPQNVN